MNKTPSYVLSREEYEAGFACNDPEFAGVEVKPSPDETYPKDAVGAAFELRRRGIDVSADRLEAMAAAGMVKPAVAGQWDRADIDQALLVADREGWLTAGAAARAYFNLSYAQDRDALAAAAGDNPDLGNDPDRYTIIIRPGAAGLGVPAVIEYRRPTAEELAELRQRINANGMIQAAAAEPELLLTGGTVELQAAAGDQSPKFTMTAYAGGTMNVSGFGAVAVDLSGMQFAATLPLLSEHNASLAGTIGSAMPTISGGKLLASGALIKASETVAKIIELARAGVPVQASIGAEPLESRMVPAGQSAMVNGQSLQGPFRLVSKSRLREISIVSIGADAGTSVRIAAQRQGIQQPMTQFNSSNVIAGDPGDVDPAIQAERTRTSAIAALAAKYPAGAKFIEAGIADGSTPNDVELKCLRASRPGVPNVTSGRIHGADTSRLMAAALTTKLCGESHAEKLFGEVTMEASKRMHRMHMLDLCRIACEADGIIVGDGSAELVRAALSGVSLPNALGDSAEKRLLQSYNEAPATWRSFASIQPASNFKGQKSLRPSWDGNLQEVAPGGELKHGTISEDLVVDWSIDTFGQILAIDRRDVVNDDLSIFDQAADAMGRKALRGVSDLVWQTILANGGSFFNATLMSGGSSPLSIASLGVAIGKFLVQRDADGNDLDVRPEVLCVPPELKTQAQAILTSLEVRPAAAETGDAPTGNAMRDALRLEVESRMSNTTKWPSTASLTAWYVFGAPSSSPVIVGFLDGRQTPVVEALGMAAQANRLAYQWRVYHDYGAALGDPRAAVKSAGA